MLRRLLLLIFTSGILYGYKLRQLLALRPVFLLLFWLSG